MARHKRLEGGFVSAPQPLQKGTIILHRECDRTARAAHPPTAGRRPGRGYGVAAPSVVQLSTTS
jgi:hypothetical protein